MSWYLKFIWNIYISFVNIITRRFYFDLENVTSVRKRNVTTNIVLTTTWCVLPVDYSSFSRRSNSSGWNFSWRTTRRSAAGYDSWSVEWCQTAVWWNCLRCPPPSFAFPSGRSVDRETVSCCPSNNKLDHYYHQHYYHYCCCCYADEWTNTNACALGANQFRKSRVGDYYYYFFTHIRP